MTEYAFPETVKEATALLDRHHGEAQIIAGGTDLLPDIRDGKKRPRCLVDVTRIPGLDQIRVTERFVQVGAAVTFAALKDNAWLRRHVPALPDAAASVGAIGIQTAATWAGNIVQAMPAADGAIVAIALETQARVVSDGSAEWRAVESLFLGPGRSAIDPTRQFITHLRFPRPQRHPEPIEGGLWGSAWKRIGRRPSLVLPILNCAVTLQLNESQKIERATIALGPVAPRPFRAREAETYLQGRPPTPEHLTQAARLARRASQPRSSVMRASRAYRLTVAETLVQQALAVAARRAAGLATRNPQEEPQDR